MKYRIITTQGGLFQIQSKGLLFWTDRFFARTSLVTAINDIKLLAEQDKVSEAAGKVVFELDTNKK